jgi:hypothetical protein
VQQEQVKFPKKSRKPSASSSSKRVGSSINQGKLHQTAIAKNNVSSVKGGKED